jgi:hypothetical protein
MTKQLSIKALYATSLLAISLASISANAALTKVAAQPRAEQAIVEDEITPEAPAALVAEDDERTVVVKRKVKQKTIVRERSEVISEAPIQTEAPVVAAAPVAAPPAAKPSMGSQLDNGVKTKMEDVQNQFEQALLKSLDRIKISVDDGAPAAGSAVATQSVVVQDTVVARQAAPKAEYLSVNDAPEVKEADDSREGESVASLPKEDKASARKIRFAPVIGKSMMNSSAYQIDSKITAGIEVEMDLEKNFSLVLGYSYSQYGIGLGATNPFLSYGQSQGYSNGYNTLNYNQNLFEVDGRAYLMPQESKFRVFGGLGIGYNLGYLNYAQNSSYAQYGSYYNSGIQDYEVKSWMGIISAGALLNVSENVSIGALFKYAVTFSSSQNQQLSNYAFAGNGYNSTTNDQAVVGGSLAQDNFYSILGTVKVAF